jgi:hypothetical protein
VKSGLSGPDTARGRLQRACLDILLRHEADGEIPTDTRFVYYELKQSGFELKHHQARRDDQDVIDAVMHLRETGLVPWGWIVDETRNADSTYADKSVAAWLLGVLGQARINPWDGVRAPVIITESRGVRAALRATAHRYAATITSTNGQCGGFLRTDVAPLLHAGQHVAYLGDWNPAGSAIEANTRRVLERTVGPLDWERLAITDEQAEREGLPPKPGTDRRYADDRPHVSYEAEALGQGRLTEILAVWLEALLPWPLAAVLEREEPQRERIAAVLRTLQ